MTRAMTRLSMIRYPTIALALICVAAIAIRVTYRAYTGSADFWQDGYIFYYDIASNFVAGKGLVNNSGDWAMRPPIYPSFLALTAIAGEHYMLIVIPQALFGTGTVICAFLIGNELFDQRTAILAALFTAFYPYYVVHDTALQETSMMTFFVACSVYLLLRAKRSQSLGSWLAAGAMLGLSVLIRTTMLPFALAAVAWIAVFGEGACRQRLLRASVVFLALVASVGGWMGRNYIVVDRAVLSSEAGFQFWAAHNPQTFSHYPAESIDRSTALAFEALTLSDKQKIEALSGNELARSDWFLQRGLDYVQQNPDIALAAAVRKVTAGFSWILNPRKEPFVQIIYALSYAPIFILGILGMLLARQGWREHSLVYLLFLTFIVVSAIFWAHTSHRTYLDVYLIVFAAFAAQRVLEFGTRMCNIADHS
jgi:4-amino-4-deoxy-L-arabinose transferase-like glycosyltransferase